MNISIRNIVRTDLEAVVELLQMISAYKPQANEFEAIWLKFQEHGNVHGIVATIHDHGSEALVGFGSLCVNLKIRGGALGHIEDIAVHASYRRCGIGRLIVTTLIELAAKNNCYKVSLECRKENVTFYERLGFANTGSAMSLLISD